MSQILGPRTMTERVADRLRTEIQTGELAPGARLLQNPIAERLGVSTTPVREAFQVLQAEGLVVIDRHRGAVVFRPTQDDLRECFEIREMLEPYAAAKAVPNLSDEDIVTLQGYLDEMRVTTVKRRWVELNNAFHLGIYAASGMPRLCRIIDGLRDASGAYLHLFAAARLEGSAATADREAEHQQILDACRTGDADAAAELTRTHLWGAVHDLLTDGDDGDPWHVRLHRHIREISNPDHIDHEGR